jgi:orotidine-5'-phosphate decarboxylase
MSKFVTQLAAAWQANNSLLCVGLDPDVKKLPKSLQGKPDAILQFGKAIVDATADLVCAFKPQVAYFAAERAEDQLLDLIAYIKANHPAIPVILDAKRGDIGATGDQYAREAFERYQADAVTVAPFMGSDSVSPFTAYKDKGVIILCRTSNPGGGDFQDLLVGSSGLKLYQHVARTIAEKWNANGNCGLVVGATYPAELSDVRKLVGDLPLLVPGIGAQGGDIEATVKAGKTVSGTGMVINSGRAILYASDGDDYALAARKVAKATREAINQHR